MGCVDCVDILNIECSWLDGSAPWFDMFDEDTGCITF